MRRSMFARSVVIAASAALLAAGCGGGASTTANKDPKTAFKTGLSGLNDSDVVTVTVKLDTTADTLMSLAKNGGDTLDATTADAIANAQFVFEAKTLNGKNLSEIKPGQTDATATRFALSDNGTTYAELRARDKTLYVQADVKGLLGLFGKSKAYTELQARANTLPAFVKALVGGQWVSIDTSILTSLAGQFGVSASPNPTQAQKLLNDIESVVQRDVTVTRVGTDDQGDHLRLTAKTSTLVPDLFQAVSGAIPGAGLAATKLDPSKIPDLTITVDAWVNNGALSKLTLDIGQFIPAAEKSPGQKLVLVVTFDRSGDDINKPDNSTAVDLSQLMGLLGGLGAPSGH